MFGFTERVRFIDPDGVVRAAEMYAGDTLVHMDGVGPGHWEGKGFARPVGQLVIVYVNDVDAHHARTVAAGVEAPELQDQFYGAHVYTLGDPVGTPGPSGSTCATRPSSPEAGRRYGGEGELPLVAGYPPSIVEGRSRKLLSKIPRHHR